jgi:hypothetical protein
LKGWRRSMFMRRSLERHRRAPAHNLAAFRAARYKPPSFQGIQRDKNDGG